MEITIEKGIPIPSSSPHAGGITATLRALEVGDSFAVPSTRKNPSIIAGLGNRQCHPKKFRSRKQPDGTYRVWRIA